MDFDRFFLHFCTDPIPKRLDNARFFWNLHSAEHQLNTLRCTITNIVSIFFVVAVVCHTLLHTNELFIGGVLGKQLNFLWLFKLWKINKCYL